MKFRKMLAIAGIALLVSSNAIGKEAEDKGNKEKDSKEKSFKKALDAAKAMDKAEEKQWFNAHARFKNLYAFTMQDAHYSQHKGELSGIELGLRGQREFVSAGNQVDELKQEIKYLGMFLYSHLAKAEAKAVISGCAAKAREAMKTKQGLRVDAYELPRHTVFMTKVELLYQYGHDWFMSRINRSGGKLMPLSQFMKSLDDRDQIRSYMQINVDRFRVKCEVIAK